MHGRRQALSLAAFFCLHGRDVCSGSFSSALPDSTRSVSGSGEDFCVSEEMVGVGFTVMGHGLKMAEGSNLLSYPDTSEDKTRFRIQSSMLRIESQTAVQGVS